MTSFVTHCEVVSKQLHDKCAVFVRVFIQCIQLCNGFIKGLQAQGHNKLKYVKNHKSQAPGMQTMCLMKFKAWGKAKNPEGQVGKISIGISLCWAKGLIKVEVSIFYYYQHLKEWKKMSPNPICNCFEKNM